MRVRACGAAGVTGVSAPRAVSNVSFHAPLAPSFPLPSPHPCQDDEAKVHNNEERTKERGSEESRGKWILHVSAEGGEGDEGVCDYV